MNFTIELLMTYGYAAVFVCVLAEQLGVPLPAACPYDCGRDRRVGQAEPLAALLLAVAASLIGDSVWYYLGKARGMAVLRLLCKISLEPDTCVQRTSSTYSKHGARWLLFAKFIPGSARSRLRWQAYIGSIHGSSSSWMAPVRVSGLVFSSLQDGGFGIKSTRLPPTWTSADGWD